MLKRENYDREVTFDLKEHLGVISESNTDWTKELNVIAWNGGEPKYDIRDWDPEHQKMSRGVTLTKEQLSALRDLIADMDLT